MAFRQPDGFRLWRRKARIVLRNANHTILLMVCERRIGRIGRSIQTEHGAFSPKWRNIRWSRAAADQLVVVDKFFECSTTTTSTTGFCFIFAQQDHPEAL
jgi:hypothetical protein